MKVDDWFDDEDDMDTYNKFEERREDDELDDWEEGFMEGYEKA